MFLRRPLRPITGKERDAIPAGTPPRRPQIVRPRVAATRMPARPAPAEDSAGVLYGDWRPVILQWCTVLGGPDVDPEDAAQDVLVVWFRRKSQLYGTDVLPAWLFGITRRVLAQHRRLAWLRRRVPGGVDGVDSAAGPDRVASLAETRRRVGRALAMLPHAEREVLTIGSLQERSDAEVAELLGIPLGTAKSRIRRAHARFREVARRTGIQPLECRP